MTPLRFGRWDGMCSIHRLQAALLMLVCATAAYAWGKAGHRVVARIADDLLTDEARARVRFLLHGNSLESVSVFADHYRLLDTNTAPWHFVDIPVSANDYDPARDCRRHHGCVVEALDHFQKVLADTHTSATNRAFALMFVVHLVGDLHQPLHCADNNDRGGNDVAVTFFGEADSAGGTHWNLHSVWDTGLIGHRNLTDAAYASRLSAR